MAFCPGHCGLHCQPPLPCLDSPLLTCPLLGLACLFQIYFYTIEVFRTAKLEEALIPYVALGLGTTEFVSVVLCVSPTWAGRGEMRCPGQALKGWFQSQSWGKPLPWTGCICLLAPLSLPLAGSFLQQGGSVAEGKERTGRQSPGRLRGATVEVWLAEVPTCICPTWPRRLLESGWRVGK